MTNINKTPLISVIVPVYNVEKYLARCLDSILGQTYKNLEIICVNDGSLDNSRQILQEYAEKDSRIILIDKPNGGLSSARNAGMALAKGEFISFVDSDDYLETICFSSCIDHFDNDVDVVAFSYVSISENGKKDLYKQKLKGKILFSDGMLFKQPWNVWCKIFRTSTLKRYDMTFKEGMIYEDLEFCARFFLVCRPVVVYLEDAFYNYWQNINSIIGKTRCKKEGFSIQHIYHLDSIYDFLMNHNSLSLSLKDFLYLCEYCFRSACRHAPEYEQAKCFAEMTSRLRKYNLEYGNNSLLSALHDGKYFISFPSVVPTKDIKGFEKIFCIRNELGYKVIRVFGKQLVRLKRG